MEARLRLKGTGTAWVLMSAVMALGTVATWNLDARVWSWEAAQAFGQPWRWWSAAFVHWNEVHLGINLLGLVVVAILGRAAAVPTPMAMAWLASWPPLHLALLLDPALPSYGGLSGLLHSGVAVVAVWLVLRWPGRGRWAGWALFIGLVLKIMLERPWAGGTAWSSGLDLALAPQAHASGALCGLFCALLVSARGSPVPAD